MYSAAITGSGIQALDTITLRLLVNVAAGTATPTWTYTVGGSPFSGSGSPVQLSGATLSALQGSYSLGGTPSALAVGIISTSEGSGDPFTAFWQSINITAQGPTNIVTVTQSGGSTAVTEGGATDTLSLALTSQPTSNVTVTLAGNADLGLSPTTLTFTSANWNTPQTVTVSAINDTLVEGPETASVTVTTSSSDSRYNNLSIAPVPVSVTDNDQPSAAPTGLDLAAADDSGLSNVDNITAITSGLTITGAGQNGATVTLYDDANNNSAKDPGEASLATAIVSNGVFSADIALASGSHQVRAFQTSSSGVASASSSSLNIVVDTNAPTPVITSTALLANGRHSIVGQSEGGTVVSIFDGGVKIGSATATSSGTWSFITSTRPSDTLHVYNLSAVDTAGNVGPGLDTAIFGTSGANSVSGGTGDDFILGRGGGDQLNGGAGDDVFSYAAAADSRPGTGNFDAISHFVSGEDMIDLAAINGLNELIMFAQTPASIPGRSVAVVTSGSNTIVYANTSNSAQSIGSTDMEILIVGVTNLAPSDFLF
jgi:hypothetical protein